MDEIQTYFATLASDATKALQAKYPSMSVDELRVANTGQQSQMTGWQSVAVHPLQSLETGYQAVVRRLTAAAEGDDAQKEAEHQALSRFFVLAATKPQLLNVADNGIAEDLVRIPLIDDELDAIESQLQLARRLITEPSADRKPLNEMGTVVERAVDLLIRMAPGKSADAMPPELQKAAIYLGLPGNPAPADVARNWLIEHQNVSQPDDLKGLADELENNLVGPLSDPANVVASARSLYNISAFYLYRLMHRFHGGSSMEAMTTPIKQEASGLVTGAMHPARLAWLAAWHEKQIATFGAQLDNLSLKLQDKFRRSTPVLRFYLKGGRAMFTALGAPQLGTNDWDTGVLIDPELPAEAWYTAFAAVNDTVIKALDELRYGYTELLYGNKVALAAPAAAMLAMSVPSELEEEPSEYTLAGAQADALAENAQQMGSSRSQMMSMSIAGLQAAASGTPRPTGINGELIDIGIATRSSVELREHWAHVTVTKTKGVSGELVPVPQLGFFVDDFSTILRGAVTTPETADRKLAKRLDRLDLVLKSGDEAIAGVVTEKLARLKQYIPKTIDALKPADGTAEGRLQIWTLDALLESLHVDDPSRQTWSGALDAYIQSLVTHGQLYDDRSEVLTMMWAQISDAFSSDESKAAHARQMLSIFTGTHELASTIVKDFQRLEIAFGLPQLGQPVVSGTWRLVSNILTALSPTTRQTADGNGTIAITGALAARLHLLHAGLPADLSVGTWPVEQIDLELWLTGANLPQAGTLLSQLASRLRGFERDVAMKIVGDGDKAKLLVILKSGVVSAATVIQDPQPVLATISIVDAAARSGQVNDIINNWPVTPARDLALHFLGEAAEAEDYDIRQLRRGSTKLIVNEVLGRQLE
ncbi:hypothetical protein SB861_46595 [Paraburkholderia sp. SIMBA_049]